MTIRQLRRIQPFFTECGKVVGIIIVIVQRFSTKSLYDDEIRPDVWQVNTIGMNGLIIVVIDNMKLRADVSSVEIPCQSNRTGMKRREAHILGTTGLRVPSRNLVPSLTSRIKNIERAPPDVDVMEARVTTL
jgi:hypothetical protein